MANEEHLKILRQGTAVWNQWRKDNPDKVPDLSVADLREANLSKTDLSKTDLSGTDLTTANLFGADLNLAKLNGTDISKANLSEADLRWADLSGTDLRRSNLSKAHLEVANFRGADLSETNFEDSSIYETVFADTNLKDTKGLDKCQHFGPSTIDHRTIRKSYPLPLAFLRGCGLPDSFIYYLPSLLEQPWQYYSCFISYSSKDKEAARRLYADLQDNGVRCWLDEHDMKGGKKTYLQIDEAIRIHDRVLLVLSENSMQSEWVITEIRKALALEKSKGQDVLFPIRLVDMDKIKAWECFDSDTGVDLAKKVRDYFIPDFQNWQNHSSYKQSFDKLLRDLKSTDKKSKPTT